MTLYHAAVTVHLLAALFWLGGMLFLAVVGAPVLREVEPRELRARLFGAIGRRYRSSGWAAIAVLLATGTLLLHLRGVLRPGVLGDAEFWATGFGRALAAKLAAVILILALQAAHDFRVGPRASRAPPGSADALALRRRAAWLSRLAVLVGVVLVGVAVRLARGG